MTTDASPVNHYLLFQHSNDFSTDTKIDYAIHHHRLFSWKRGRTSTGPTSIGTELERRMLVRSIDELKRCMLVGDRVIPATPSTGNTFHTSASAYNSPTGYGSFPPCGATGDWSTSTYPFDGPRDADVKPWDDAAEAQTSHWSWPMEVLYQKYHLWIALDYGRDMFTVTHNGVVLADRIPAVVSSLLQVVETTLVTREQEAQQLRAFIESAIGEEETRRRARAQVWDPSIDVSVVLLNVPPEMEKDASCGRSCDAAEEDMGGDTSRVAARPLQPTIRLCPPEHPRFSAFEAEGGGLPRCSAVTVLSHCDARELLADGTFMERLSDLLSRYESHYRERSRLQTWPQTPLSTTVDFLVRAMPETSAECNTIVLVSHLRLTTSSDAFAFREGVVRRKNLILSVVALNRTLLFDSPELHPFVRLVSSVGGFLVRMDFWLSLAAPRLNYAWCRKFEGARCLAQQIFVHLINGFPVAIPGATRHNLLADTLSQPVVLYDGDHELPNFISHIPVEAALRTLAALRFNQGWSVLLDYRGTSSPHPLSPTANMAARYTHDFLSGTITLHYAVAIEGSAVSRRLLVSGTKALVDLFCQRRCDGISAAGVDGMGSGYLLAYLSLLRSQVVLWMKSEQVLQSFISADPRSAQLARMPDLSRFSSAEYLLGEWFNITTVASVGIFFQLEQLSSSTLIACCRSPGGSAALIEPHARACLHQAMRRRHRLVGEERDLTYLHMQTTAATARTSSSSSSSASSSGTLIPAAPEIFSLVQFFPLQEVCGLPEFGLAGAFECRVSCAHCDQTTLEEVIQAVLRDVREAVRERNDAVTRRDRRLLVRTSHLEEDEVSLQLMKSSQSRRRLQQPASYGMGATAEVVADGGLSGGPRGAAQATPKAKVPYHRSLTEAYPYNPTVLFPWALLNAISFRWILEWPVSFPFLSEDIFSFAVLRRLHAGFTLIACYPSSRKALLVKRMGAPADESNVLLLDVVEEALPTPSVVGCRLSVRRLVTPFKRARYPRWRYTYDIQEDLHVATALFTCRVLSDQSSENSCVEPPTPRGHGLPPITARVESLLPYLQSRYTTILSLESPQSLGMEGCVQLRDRLLNVVSCAGYHSVIVKARLLDASYVQLLSSGAAAVDPEADVYVSLPSPKQYQTILCLLMLERDVAEEVEGRTVKVALASLDPRLLGWALTQKYRSPPPGPAGGDDAATHSVGVAEADATPLSATPLMNVVMPDCAADGVLVQALLYLLRSFTAVFCARALIRLLKSRPEGDAEEVALRELSDTLAQLGSYTLDLDATHLLRLVQWRFHGTAADVWASGLLEVLKGVLASQCSSPVGHPTLWLPRFKQDRTRRRAGEEIRGERELASTLGSDTEEGSEGTGGGDTSSDSVEAGVDEEEGREAGGAARLDVMPVAFKVCASIVTSSHSTGGEEMECRWISSVIESQLSPMRNILRDDTEWAMPPDATGDVDAGLFTAAAATTAGITSSTAAIAASLTLHIVVKTVPFDLVELCEDESLRPPQWKVLRTLVHLYERFEKEGASSDHGSGTTSIVATSALPVSAGRRRVPESDGILADTEQLFAQPAPVVWEARRCAALFEALTHDDLRARRVTRAVRRFSQGVEGRIATYCLRSAYACAVVAKVKEVVMAEMPVSASTNTTSGGDAALGKGREKPHESARVLDAVLSHSQSMKATDVTQHADLRKLLSEVVLPALRCSCHYTRCVFPVYFTQHTTEPAAPTSRELISDVFRRCVEEDQMWVISPVPLFFFIIPNQMHFNAAWVVVRADATVRRCRSEMSILYYDCHATATSLLMRKTICERLSSRVSSKMRQVNQLLLLKQLRETMKASAELIPPGWGDQFSQSCSTFSVRIDQPRTSRARSPAASTFYLHGRKEREIPLYYKLQHQCKKILSRIQSNCARLGLLRIVDSEQCYLVDDEKAQDTFHYVRLVFVKDTAIPVSVSLPSPPLSDTDCCPLLVVQLFSATANASVQQPLEQLEDFCYFLAVQELQGHLSYVRQTMISSNDLVFLQSQRLLPVSLHLNRIFEATGAASCPETSDGTTANRDEQERQQRELALALLFLNLRENKFKPLQIQDEPIHLTSNFLAHYKLESSLDQELAKHATLAQESRGSRGGDDRVWRFVKMVDGLTDLLVSCCMYVQPDHPATILLDGYHTRIPQKRYINGDSESTIVAHLHHCVAEATEQLRVYALISPDLSSSPLERRAVPAMVTELVHIDRAAASKDSSLMRTQHFPLDLVSPNVLPMLIERVCGALAQFEPLCFTVAPGQAAGGAKYVPNFSWRWMEGIQNDASVDELVVYITCGFRIVDTADATAELSPTHVVPYMVPDVTIASVTTGEAQRSALHDAQLGEGEHLLGGFRIALSVSCASGMLVSILNLRDTEYLVRLLGYVVQEMEERSALLEDVLLQRMGYTVPSTFNEADLARLCCGDETNVLAAKTVSIFSDTYRRRVNNVRFRPYCNVETEEPLVVMLEGLYNRGLIWNYAFAMEDAIKVLFDEFPQASLQECVARVKEFLAARILSRVPQSTLKPQVSLRAFLPDETLLSSDATNCRLNEVALMPPNALVACGYHRHVVAAHIIVEAQNARSGVAELLERCDTLWRADSEQHHVLELAKAVVSLQLKSKQVFGARVPEVSLQRGQRDSEDDLLDRALPSPTQQSVAYACHVNESLHDYVEYLRRLYHSLCVIELDPNDAHTTADEVLLNRLRCRYGKVRNEEEEIVLFCPHLYYAIIPLIDLLPHDGLCDPDHAACGGLKEKAKASPIATGGLFIVEVGFQVAHYALDFFVINGNAVSPAATAKVAADFRQSLRFESVLYDVAVRRLSRRMQEHCAATTGPLQVHAALNNLVRSYPSPPMHSRDIVAAYTITDPRVMLLKHLLPNGALSNSGQYNGGNGVLCLSPQQHDLLEREQTAEMYTYAGLIVWEQAQLFVLLTNAGEIHPHARESNRDLQRLVLHAKQVLLEALVERTQQGFVEVAWWRFFTDGAAAAATGADGGARRDAPSRDEFELLRRHLHKIVLHCYLPVLQRILEAVQWGGEKWRMPLVCERLYPDHVLHVIQGSPHGGGKASQLSAATPHGRSTNPRGGARRANIREKAAVAGEPAARPMDGYDVSRLFLSPGALEEVVVTFMAVNTGESNCFLAMECAVATDSGSGNGGAGVVVNELSLYCAPGRSSLQTSVVTVLSEAEEALVERFVKLVNTTVWLGVVPPASDWV